MTWPFVIIGCLFIALLGFVMKLHYDFLRIKKAASVALDELEGNPYVRQ